MCKNLCYELNPRVRCAFANVFIKHITVPPSLRVAPMRYLYISNISAALLTANATNNNTNTCPSNKILPNHLANLVDVLFEIEKCFHLIIFLQSMELDIGGPQRSYQYCPAEGLDYSDFTEKGAFFCNCIGCN